MPGRDCALQFGGGKGSWRKTPDHTRELEGFTDFQGEADFLLVFLYMFMYFFEGSLRCQEYYVS